MENNLLTLIKFKLADDETKISGHSITFLNPYSYLILRKDPCFLKYFEAIGIDGILLAKLITIFVKPVRRISFDFTSLAHTLFTRISDKSESIYFVGSTEKVIQKFVIKILAAYPKLNVAGFRNGYFKSKKIYQEGLREIIKINPDVLLIGMGSPLQEKIAYDLKNNGWKGQAITCGGFFHQTANSNSILYYPNWINKLDLRWIYRMYDEPKLVKRYLVYYPLFFAIFFKDFISDKLVSNR